MKTTLIVLALPLAALAQNAAPHAFDVATVKLSNNGGNFVEVTPGAVLVHSARLSTCIMWAYDLQSGEIAAADGGISRRLESDRYDIVAKPGGTVPERELKLMLQNLLADRFKLSAHRESREVRTFMLTIAKSGPKFHESSGDGQPQMHASGKLTRQYQWMTMSAIAEELSGAMEAPVVDQTGLKGKYDLSIDLMPFMPTEKQEGRPDIAGMMVSALQEQLGLKLEARKSQRDVLVIERLEKPSEN